MAKNKSIQTAVDVVVATVSQKQPLVNVSKEILVALQALRTHETAYSERVCDQWL
jgi:hypothetical protein